jgi:peptidoglycan lytic transglycosylase
MNRMIKLIGALGVMFIAVPAYASGSSDNNSVVSGVHSHTGHHAKTKRYARTERGMKRRHTSASRTTVKSTRTAHNRRGRSYAARQDSRKTQSGLSSLMGVFQSGIASHYWQPQKLASGGWFNPRAMTAAHKTLPFGTKVRVKNMRNGKTVDVTINDRGPYVGGRIIDLSSGAAGVIGMKEAGLAKVQLEVIGR